jgi:hypothetical protein
VKDPQLAAVRHGHPERDRVAEGHAFRLAAQGGGPVGKRPLAREDEVEDDEGACHDRGQHQERFVQQTHRQQQRHERSDARVEKRRRFGDGTKQGGRAGRCS